MILLQNCPYFPVVYKDYKSPFFLFHTQKCANFFIKLLLFDRFTNKCQRKNKQNKLEKGLPKNKKF